jgi:ATP-dependent DNA helicase RecG
VTAPRAFAAAVADGPFPEPKTAPRPSHLSAPAAPDKRTRDLLAGLRPRPVENVGDLLEHVPFRHDDFREASRLADLRIGEEATIVVTVEGVRLRPTRRRNLVIVEARVRDESGPGLVVWFNQRYLAKQLTEGMRLSVRGERRGTVGAEIVAKRHELLESDERTTHTSGLVPVYHSSERLTSRRIGDLVAGLLYTNPSPRDIKGSRMPWWG